MLCNIYGSCDIHGIIGGAWHSLGCSTEAPSPGMRPPAGGRPAQAHPGGMGWGSPCWRPPEVGSAVGLKPHLKMLRNVSVFRAPVQKAPTHPVLAWLVCLEEAGRNQMVRLRGGGAPKPQGLFTPISLSFPPPSPFPSCLPSRLPPCNI